MRPLTHLRGLRNASTTRGMALHLCALDTYDHLDPGHSAHVAAESGTGAPYAFAGVERHIRRMKDTLANPATVLMLAP